MKVEAVKKGNHYIIPYFDKIDLKQERIELEFDEGIIAYGDNSGKTVEKSKAYKALENANKRLPGDSLLELLLKNTPINYSYQQSKPDKKVLYDVLKEKYNL